MRPERENPPERERSPPCNGGGRAHSYLTDPRSLQRVADRFAQGLSAEGRMVDPFARIVENLVRRFDGPLHFRLIVQPIVAAAMALPAGIRDEREGKPPFLWAVLLQTADHRELLREAWRDLRNVLIIALTLDVTYQLIVHRRIYPLELVITVAALATPSLSGTGTGCHRHGRPVRSPADDVTLFGRQHRLPHRIP